MKTTKSFILSENHKDISALFINFINPMPMHEAVYWINRNNSNAFTRINDLKLEIKNKPNAFNFMTFRSPIPYSDEGLILLSNKSFIENSSVQNKGFFNEESMQISLLPTHKKFDIIVYSTDFASNILTTINLPSQFFFSYLAQNIKDYKNLEKFILSNE